MTIKIITKTIIYILLGIVAVFTIFPVLYTLLASFKSNQEIMGSSANIFPKALNFDNYKQAWVLANFQ